MRRAHDQAKIHDLDIKEQLLEICKDLKALIHEAHEMDRRKAMEIYSFRRHSSFLKGCAVFTLLSSHFCRFD